MICPCKYPLFINDDGIEFIAFPIESFYGDGVIHMPEILEKDGYVIVKWADHIDSNVKHYDVAGHVVIAGCEKSDIKCDSKLVYEVWHPKKEWMSEHVIEKSQNKGV